LTLSLSLSDRIPLPPSRRHRPSFTEHAADADVFEQNAEEAAELKRKRAFRKFSYRGIDLEA
jgi:hypothetical protein